MKNLEVEQKTNLKSGKSKDKKKEIETKKGRKLKKEKILMKNKLAIVYFDVVPFMKEKQRRKKNKERDQNKEPKESKKQRQEGRKKEHKKRERQRKRNTKRGRPKKAKGERKRNTENKQKMPFSRGKTRFFLWNNQKNKKNKKSGGFRAKWGGQKNKKTKKKKKQTKKNPKKKPAKIPKNELFSYQSNFSFFLGWLFKISIFWHLGPKSLNTKSTIKIGVSGPFFLKSSCVSRNGRFWTKKPKIYKFQLSFFLPIFFSFKNTKTQKSTETPIFTVFLLT